MAPRRINLDDLLDAQQVADLLGLSSATSVTTYRSRYPDDFPAPVLERSSGRCMLWYRPEIERWLKAHPRRPRRTDDEAADPS